MTNASSGEPCVSKGAVIVIAGPTAVGKSALSDIIASRLGGSVVSADAMQVYRGMDIGTAKTPVEERLVPLLMIDVADPKDAFSAALYQRDARPVIDGLLASDSVPVVCGGTGLYIDAALDCMEFPSGELESESRRRYKELAEQLGDQGLHELLSRRDPKSAELIHPHNVRRVIRALEMLDEGVSYADQNAGFSEPKPYYQAFRFALTMNRAALYERINARVDTMFECGLLDEVKALVSDGAQDALTSRQAIGYKEIIEYLEGSCTLDEAKELIKQRSRRYAKRQLSWFRRDKRFTWLDMDVLSLDDAAQFVIDSYRTLR